MKLDVNRVPPFVHMLFFWLIALIFASIPRILLLFLVAFFSCQLYYFVYFLRRWVVFFSSKKWIKIPILAIRSELVIDDLSSADDDIVSTRTKLIVVFSYKYSGEIHKGNTLHVPFYYPSNSFKNKLHAQIEKGEIKKVLVNPKKPTQSVLLNNCILSDIIISFLYLFSAGIIFYFSLLVLFQEVL